ncbi:Mitochodrial transcription termination factor-related [Macleaya cordata]|uniref:Mitochodrial transcription termination factor-related n=1 Tax=Macleaya cordata TaxID=56857 RepID=A0A200QA35_MACCD|nr:Mitochodrial transcription termination factor-related [Macleaya cordata]
MTHLQKLKKPRLLKWVSSNFAENLRTVNTGLLHTAKTLNFYSSTAENAEETEVLEEKILFKYQNTVTRVSRGVRIRNQAQEALLEYLHCTRSLHFCDAEHMSKNSPNFLSKLLKKVEDEKEIGKSLTRFLRYHPINEFEPFFESLGLDPSEFDLFLPRDLIFLSDDAVLLENYHVLCYYGISRSKIGKIYREAMDIFRYSREVLVSTLRAYENLGLTRACVIKVVVACPTLLVGGVNDEFVKVLEELKCLGIDYNWIEGRLSERNSYQWNQMLGLLRFFSEMGYSKEELGGLIRRHPGLLLDDSGTKVFSLIGLLLKFGCSMNEISSLFPQLPRDHVGTFMNNLRQGFMFLVEIEMDSDDIRKIVRAHPLILGSCFLKKPNSVLAKLNIGKKRLCGIIKEDPLQLKNWILGSRLDPLPKSEEDQRSLMQKMEFLMNLGFVKNSDEMENAIKVFRGRGGKLQERFDCFVKAGLDPKDVSEMLKVAPQVLNQTRAVIERKIDFLVNGLGYPISSLVAFPAYISYTIQRVKLRHSMYNWLMDEGVAAPMLALSTIIACSEKVFIRQFVKHHPRGHEVWQKLKKVCSVQ